MEIINREKKEMVPLTHEEIFIINKKYVKYAKKKKNFVWIKLIKII